MNKEKGQMMVEALIALGVAVIIIAAITSMIVSALSNAIAAKNQDLATQYAKQGIEVVRNISKTDWTYFKDLSNTFCLNEGSNTLSGTIAGEKEGCGQNLGNFIRNVEIVNTGTDCGEDISKVTVNVFWSDNKCTESSDAFCHSVKLESCLSDVNNISQ